VVTVPGAGWLKAIALIPVRPPSVSEAVFSPVIVSVKLAVLPPLVIEFSTSV